MKWNFFVADRVVANNNTGADLFAPKRKYKVILNGYDLEKVYNDNSKEIIKKYLLKDKITVGMVANFTKHKDYKTFFEAAKIVLEKKNNTIFIALGTGELLNEYQTFVHKSGLMDNVIFINGVTEVEPFIKIFNIAVLTSFSEGISNSIMEYCALGKPVIATDVGGTKEIITDKVNGFLVPPKSPERLAEKIIYLIDNPALRDSMGLIGKELIEKKFSLYKMVNEYQSLYQELITEK
jgi:glycosyltransferase involved in cell wall biosynthesis